MTIKNKGLASLAIVVAIAATYASAQAPKPAPAASSAKMECPMMKDDGKRIEVSAKAENTAGGAIVRIQAKNTAEVADVQRMAQTLAKHLEEGCPMMDKHKHGGMHGGMHGHGMHH